MSQARAVSPPRATVASRREFLATATVVLAGGAAARQSVAAHAEPWRPRYALASALYGGFSLAEILPEVGKTGAAMIDLWPRPHGSQREEVDALGEEKVRKMLADHGVRLGGIACYKTGAFNLAGEFALAQRLGGEGTVLVATAPGDGSVTEGELVPAIRSFLEKLKPSIAAARATGGVIAIENHSKSLLQTPGGIRAFAGAVEEECVGVALAPHHLPQDPELVAGLAADLGPRLKFVYAQQHGRGSQEKCPPEEALLQLPGRGPLDFGPLMQQLATMRFVGPVEIFMHPTPRGIPILPSVAEITAEVSSARRYLDGLISAVHYRRHDS